MNAKKCKALRRQARKLATDMNLPERDVIETNVHPKLYPWLVKTKLDSHGNEKIVDTGVREVHQLVNSRHSFRGEYLHLKREARRA